MKRRIAASILLVAWLCASGAMLDCVQVVAWARMFSGFARTDSALAAARRTFEPGQECVLCRAVARARQAGSPASAPVQREVTAKIVLIADLPAEVVLPAREVSWEAPADRQPIFRSAEVRLRPPRTAGV